MAIREPTIAEPKEMVPNDANSVLLSLKEPIMSSIKGPGERMQK